MPLSLLLPSAEGRTQTPQHRTHNPRRVSHTCGLAILRFRSPLLTESQLFSLPTGTEMFHFPALPPNGYIFTAGDTTSLAPGFPIRTSSDPRSVDSSPRHNAASHVLHRLSVPRHPPCALKHLQHKKPKIELKNSEIAHQHNKHTARVLDARNHYPQIKHHTPPPKTGRQPVLSPVSHHQDEEIAGLLSQSPIVCLAIPHRPGITRTGSTCLLLHPNHTHYRRWPISRFAQSPNPTRCGRAWVSWCSLERR